MSLLVASFCFTSGLMAFTSRQLCGLLLRPLAVIEVELHMTREPSLIGRIWALPNAVRQTQTYPNPDEDFVFTAVDPFVNLQLPYHLQQQGHRLTEARGLSILLPPSLYERKCHVGSFNNQLCSIGFGCSGGFQRNPDVQLHN
jgi:hypothetical protein